MKKEEKQAFVEQMKRRFETAPGAMAADFRGLNVENITELRRRMRAATVEFRVVKNTLTRLAAKGTPLEPITQLLEGPTALAIHASDPTVPAKVLLDFVRDHKGFAIKGGALAGRLLSAREVEALARMPARPEMLSILAGTLKSGPQTMCSLLAAAPRQMAGLLVALKEKKPVATAIDPA